ncbi:MAG TPA: DUF1127 domain-containing protein [Casimicrobiaceae bacterium]|jgi:uncharacterized protein YjiS (DUF1127 family)|nr:DUF1127 domain-containing protein [Casimicrobiaceae bacterium]
MAATTYRSAELLFRAASAMQLAAQSLRALAERLEIHLENRRASRRAVREFSSMSDRDLKDIGLTRSDTDRVALSPAHAPAAAEAGARALRDDRGEVDALLVRFGFWLHVGYAGAAALGAALIHLATGDAHSLAGWALAFAGAALMAAGWRRGMRVLRESHARAQREAAGTAGGAKPAIMRRRAINGPAVKMLAPGLRARVDNRTR